MKFNQETDQPLDEHLESMIDRIGSKMFLQGCIEEFGITISTPIDQLTDEEARKVCRGIYRNAADYKGPIQ